MKFLKPAFSGLIVLMAFSLGSAADSQYTQDKYEIRDHMREMYVLKDQIFSRLDQEDREAIAEDISMLRAHLHSVMPKTPSKIQNLPDTEKRDKMLEYQKHIAKVILITIDLEQTILKVPLNDIEKRKRDDKINSLATSMLRTIGQGHAQFK